MNKTWRGKQEGAVGRLGQLEERELIGNLTKLHFIEKVTVKSCPLHAN
jgi:hypothetical protein